MKRLFSFLLFILRQLSQVALIFLMMMPPFLWLAYYDYNVNWQSFQYYCVGGITAVVVNTFIDVLYKKESKHEKRIA